MISKEVIRLSTEEYCSIVSEQTTGSVVWGASFVLLDYISHLFDTIPSPLKGIRVLELGSGTGYAGMCIAKYLQKKYPEHRHDVCVTDMVKGGAFKYLKASVDKNILNNPNLSSVRLELV
eukprot:GHVR01024384.1.p1 GENE.GHVR01024384.1~~GHVR01024384.1.p1  ORF type:complete len:120 (+),score=29.73 GHVR01024384.1:40-399(+)